MSEGIGVTSLLLFKENASRVSQETKAKRPVLLIYQHCGLPLHFTNNNRDGCTMRWKKVCATLKSQWKKVKGALLIPIRQGYAIIRYGR